MSVNSLGKLKPLHFASSATQLDSLLANLHNLER